jgi:alkylhydroperoxidase/carboxymuconolactone decarboxylase family protein YurZ
VEAHTVEARRAGASKEELAETLTTAAMIASGSQLFWMLKDFERLIGQD